MKSYTTQIFPLVLLISGAAALESENVIGGEVAGYGQLPYQVSVQTVSHICGGTLIAPDVVLLAAHCVVKNNIINPRPYYALVGTTNIFGGGGQMIRVSKIYVHKRFQILTDTTLNDIALFRLAKKLDVRSDPSIGIALLPSKGENFAGKTAIVSGYGWNRITVGKDYRGKPKEHGSTSGVLRYAKVEVLEPYKCKARIYPSIICGRALQSLWSRHNGVCSGDSGGPLVYNNKIIGIVSMSPFGCDEFLYPATYTKVSDYLDLIQGAIYDNPTADTLVVSV